MSEASTKEELKAKKAKEAIAAMKSAKDNMSTALSRNEQLERCIANLANLIDVMIEHIPDKSFAYDSKETNKERFKKSKHDAMRWI